MGFDLHRKKLSVAIILGTLAICAFLLAQGSTSLLATWALPVEATPLHVNLQGTNLPPLPGTAPPDIQAMLKRNMFDPTTGPLWPPKPVASEDLVSADGSDSEDEQSLMPGEMPPPCEGSLRLVASVYAPEHPEWSFATVTTGNGAPMLYRAGTDIDGKQIDSIYPKAVFLRNGGRLCSLTLFESADGVKPSTIPKPIAPAVTRANSSTGTGMENDDLEKDIQKVSDTKYNVNRELVNKVLSNQAQLMRSARVVPHEQNGQVVGVKLYGIRRQSILGKLGLQNGDLLRNINGYDMGSPNSALEAYARLRSADALSVAITRRGQPVTLEYGIVE